MDKKKDKITEIFNYLRQCPVLADMWSIAATEEEGRTVVLPQGASQKVQYEEKINVYGDYECEIVPFPSVYEDYQINCYKLFDPKDSSAPEENVNVLSFGEVQSVCDWITEQDDNENLPQISGEQVVSIECNPPVPQIRYVNTQEGIVAYFITIRIRYVNRARRKNREYPN